MPTDGKLLPDERQHCSLRCGSASAVTKRRKLFLLWRIARKEGLFLKKLDTRMIVTLGLLTAIEIVLSRFLSIQAWNFKITLSFIPIVVAGMLYGALPAGITGLLSDFLGALLFPSGTFFPGFTLTAFLTGAIWGLFLHKKQTAARVLAAVVVNQVVCSLLLRSLWLSILYSSPYAALVASRVIQCFINGPIQFVVIRLIGASLDRIRKGAV